MDVREKIIKALSQSFQVDYVRLESVDGISGFVVSPQFEEVATMDRQIAIDEALDKASDPLTAEERRQVLMIAALTPDEYNAVGLPIRIHRVREMAGGAVEVVIRGGPSDAGYVRRTLNNHKGISAAEPKPVPEAVGILMSLRVKGTAGLPLTKAKVLRILKNDRYIDIPALPDHPRTGGK